MKMKLQHIGEGFQDRNSLLPYLVGVRAMKMKLQRFFIRSIHLIPISLLLTLNAHGQLWFTPFQLNLLNSIPISIYLKYKFCPIPIPNIILIIQTNNKCHINFISINNQHNLISNISTLYIVKEEVINPYRIAAFSTGGCVLIHGNAHRENRGARGRDGWCAPNFGTCQVFFYEK